MADLRRRQDAVLEAGQRIGNGLVQTTKCSTSLPLRFQLRRTYRLSPHLASYVQLACCFRSCKRRAAYGVFSFAFMGSVFSILPLIATGGYGGACQPAKFPALLKHGCGQFCISLARSSDRELAPVLGHQCHRTFSTLLRLKRSVRTYRTLAWLVLAAIRECTRLILTRLLGRRSLPLVCGLMEPRFHQNRLGERPGFMCVNMQRKKENEAKEVVMV